MHKKAAPNAAAFSLLSFQLFFTFEFLLLT